MARFQPESDGLISIDKSKYELNDCDQMTDCVNDENYK